MSIRCTTGKEAKKANWLKRGIILVAIVVTVGLFLDSMGTL